MAQLHCYVPEEIADQAQRRAEQAGLSLSRYLAELVKRDASAAAGWPEGYVDLPTAVSIRSNCHAHHLLLRRWRGLLAEPV